MHITHTISPEAMNAHRKVTINGFDFNPSEMERRSRQYATTQQSSSKRVVREGVREVNGGQIKQFVAWWEYADGSRSEFDGMSWTNTPAPATK